MQSSLFGALLAQSLRLDQATLRDAPLTQPEKLEFIAKKYGLLARHARRSFILGEDSVELSHKTLWYDSRYGLAGLQRSLTSHAKEFGVLGHPPVDTVIDVGANVGWFSLTVRRLYPTARIYAVEPIPATFHCLQRNLSGDEASSIYQLAISDANGQAAMNFDPNESALSALDPSGTTLVRALTLDAFARQEAIEAVDVLKIDTEGFEDAVFAGGMLTLARTRYLFVEVTIDNNDRYSLPSLLAALAHSGGDFELRTFRNFTGRYEGAVPAADCVFENRALAPRRGPSATPQGDR